MTTADTDALTGTHDLIVNAIWNAANGRPIPFNPDDLAASVLPIVADEVRKAKAEALREVARGFFAMSPHITYSGQHVQERLLSRADRYETGGSDEHR